MNSRTLELKQKIVTLSAQGMFVIDNAEHNLDTLKKSIELARGIEPILIELSVLEPTAGWEAKIERCRSVVATARAVLQCWDQTWH